MCIIAIKPKGVEMPDKDTIYEMWASNNDGFGMMYPKNGKVFIEKGYMKYKAMRHRLDQLSNEIDTTKTPIIFHFRIGTAGGNIPANTHPFPVSASIGALQKTRLHTDLAVVHNGIIHGITPRKKDISDTMEYILSQLAPLHRAVPRFYANKDICEMIYNAVQGKLAFMNGKGDIYTIGDFIEDGGMLYSNHSYKTYRGYTVRDYDGGTWGWNNWIKKYPHLAKYDDAGWTDDDWNEYYSTLGKHTDESPVLPADDDEYIHVNWLSEDDGYIRTKDGEFLECEEGSFLIDEFGRLYQYAWDQDVAVYDWESTFITHNGESYEFDYDMAELVIPSYDHSLLNKEPKSEKKVVDLKEFNKELVVLNDDKKN